MTSTMSAARCRLLTRWPKKTGDEIVLLLLARKWLRVGLEVWAKKIAQLLNDKDSENTKKSTKQHRLIF